MDSGVGRKPHRGHCGIAAGLGDFTPTQLGRAAAGFLFGRKESQFWTRKSSANSPTSLAERGSNVWFELSDADLAKELGLPAGTTKRNDTIDVWIDSGVSHQAVCALHPELRDPADMYLEATDQHRGWFQSSLMTSIALEGPRALQDLRHSRLRRRCGRKENFKVEHLRQTDGRRTFRGQTRRGSGPALGEQHRLHRRRSVLGGNVHPARRYLPAHPEHACESC